MSSTKARADSLSLLLFTLRSGKLMAINLLKVSEIIPCPPLTKLPESHPHVKGIATLRGTSLSVIDLSRAIGERPLEDPERRVPDRHRRQPLQARPACTGGEQDRSLPDHRHPSTALRFWWFALVHHRRHFGRWHPGAGAGHRESHPRHRPGPTSTWRPPS